MNYEGKIAKLIATAEVQGVAASTVKDGHVLIFSLKKLKELVEHVEKSGKDIATIFIKRDDMENLEN